MCTAKKQKSPLALDRLTKTLWVLREGVIWWVKSREEAILEGRGTRVYPRV